MVISELVLYSICRLAVLILSLPDHLSNIICKISWQCTDFITTLFHKTSYRTILSQQHFEFLHMSIHNFQFCCCIYRLI